MGAGGCSWGGRRGSRVINGCIVGRAPLWLDARARERAVVRCWRGKESLVARGVVVGVVFFSTALRRRMPFARPTQTL